MATCTTKSHVDVLKVEMQRPNAIECFISIGARFLHICDEVIYNWSALLEISVTQVFPQINSLARACQGGQKAEFTTGLALLLDVSDIAGAAEGEATVVLRPPDAAVCVGCRVAATGLCDGKLTVMDGVTLW